MKQAGVTSAPWLNYKLVNVQYFPYDKVISKPTPDGSLYSALPPYTAQNPPPSSYYQANIVVETNRSLQLFSGGLSPNISTDWNQTALSTKIAITAAISTTQVGVWDATGARGKILRAWPVILV